MSVVVYRHVRCLHRGGAVRTGTYYLQTICFYVAYTFFYTNYLSDDAIVVFINNFIAMHCFVGKELVRGTGPPCVVPLRSGDRCRPVARVAVIQEGEIPPRGIVTRVHILTLRYNASEISHNTFKGLLNCFNFFIKYTCE